MASGLANIGKKYKKENSKEQEQEEISGGLSRIGYRFKEKNQGGLAGGVGYVAGSAGVDFLRVGEGVWDAAMVPLDLMTGQFEKAGSRFMNSPVDDLRESLDRQYKPGKGMQVVGDITGGIGQSVGYGLISAIPYAGKPMMFSSIVEQGISSAAEQTGKVGWNEIAYGATTGAIEGFLEMKLGSGVKGLKSLGSSILKKSGKEVVESAAKAGGKSLLKTVALDTAKGAAGEFAEEAISEAVDPLLLQLYNIDENAQLSWENVLYAGVVGGVSGGIMSAGPSAINYKSAVSTGRAIQQNGLEGDMLTRAKTTLTVLDASVTETESRIKGKPVGEKTESREAKRERLAENRRAKQLSKETRELADKLRKNIYAYESMMADPSKARSDVAAAVLGEMRGNLFLVGFAYEADVIEQVLMGASAEQKQSFVNEINAMLEKQGQKHDYTVADFENNVDDIRRGLAGRLMMDELQGNTAEGGAGATHTTKEATTSPWDGMADNEDMSGYKATGEAEKALLWAAVNENVPRGSVQAMLDEYRKGTDMTPEEFAEAWSDGVHLIGRFDLTVKEDEDTAFNRLPKEAREAARRIGRETAERENAQREAKAKAKKKPAPAAKAEGEAKAEGRVVRGKGVNVQSLSDAQYAAYKAAEVMAKRLGTDIVIEASIEDTAGRATYGYYDRKTNTIHININALRNGKHVALYTLGHEVTHYIKEWSPAKFKVLSDFVMDRMSGDAKDLIDAKFNLLRGMEEYEKYTVAELNELAAEEVVADGMELILTDGKVLEELAKTDKSLWEKIRDWIFDIIGQIRRSWESLNQASKTAQVLKGTVESLEEIERLFTEGAMEAGERAKAAGVKEVAQGAAKKGDVSYSIDEDTDTAYLTAVERGDMETAQRMVDEAASAAGYANLFYHGAKKGGGFTVFRDWSYFTENKAYAERYTDREKPSSLYKTYVKMDNTFDTRKAKDRKLFAEIRDEYGLSEIQDTGLPDWTDGYDIAEYIDENDLDYDSIVLDEGGDLVDGVPISRGLSYVVRKSAQIKYADPVTYDGNGNVIPLSERFNEKNPDIRYSLGEETADVTESEKLKAEKKKLEEQVQRMKYRQFRKAVESGEMEAKVRKQELSDGATTVLESIGITDGRNHAELTRRMSELYAKMAGERKISYNEAFDEATKIAEWLMNIQPDIRDMEASERAREILKTVRGTKIRLTFTQKGEVANLMGSSDAYRKSMFGKITVTDQNGVPLDVQWEEWSDLYPDVFSKDVDEADMPDRLLRIYDTLTAQRDRTESIDEYINQDELAAEIFTQVGQIGWNEIQTEEAIPDLSDREMLLAIAEQMVGSENEYKIISDYKKKYDGIRRKEKRIQELNDRQQELQSILFTSENAKARSDASKELRAIYEETSGLLEEVAEADKKLANIEGMKAIRNLIKVERMEARETSKTEYKKMQKASAERKEITIRMREARRVLGYLSTMLYHPTKQKHVPESLQALVEKALRSADPKQFGINRDHIREMSELAGKIRKLESKAGRTTAEQETLDKMKTKYEKLEADTISVKRQAEALMTAFEQYVTSTTDGEQIDKNMLEGLRQTVTEIEEAPLNEMTLESLKAVEKIYTVIYHQVNTANQAFATEKAASIDQMSTKANTEVKEAKALRFLSPQAREWAALSNVRSFLWKNMKPLTVFEAVGSNELMTIFRRVLDAEDVWITDVLEAKETLDKAKKQYGYNKWNLKERRDITTADGSKASLTLGEMMSLYAYMFREQAEEHLSAGGFVFAPNAEAIESFKGDKGKYRTHLNDQTPHRMRKEDIAKMSDMLTEEQRAYAKTVQEYLTSLGAKGNEVSRKLYGIDLFKETAYFPIKSSHDYIETSTGKSGDPNIKSRGTFKETVPRAGNPIVLEDFMEVVGNHVNTMATYHAFVLPVEDLTRVWNYTPVNIKRDADGKAILDENGMPVADTEGAVGYNSLKAEITKKYGKEANDYILQLLRDLNGGARRESAASILDKGLTAFKRSATMLSLSTIVQQPTSFVRAMAYIKPEYFKGASKVAWETVKKYAPVAAIKEMGGFDTGTGARTSEFLNAKEYDSLKDAAKAAVTPEVYGGDPNVRAEAFGWLTAKADEITWQYMFGACVNEQAAKLGKAKDSEEVLQAAGKRFAEVVRHTQVYDSTLTRSEYMRSKDGLMKMATAFGAEPTTVFSMAAEALIKLERGDKTFFKNTAAAVAGSILLNAVVSSLVYAMRDDDEDKNFLEKYTESVTGEIIEGFNPLEYLPILRDVMSVFKGYDIERTDMSLISNLYQQVELITSSKRSPMDKIAGVSGAVGAFFGIPITNVYRDAKGLALTTSKVLDPEPITGRGVGKAVGEGFKGQFGLFDKLFGKERGDSYELYRAYVKGDEAQYARIAARYDTPEAEEQALRRELRENEKRIVEAAEAKYSGELEVYESLVDQIAAEGVFDRSMVIRAVNNEVSAIKRAAEKGEITAKEDTADEEVAESLYSSSDLNAALERGDTEDYESIYEYLIAYKTEQGKTEAQARSAVKSSITSYWKKRWLAGYQDTETRKRIIQLLTDTGLYGSRNDVALMCEGWVKDAAKKQ